MASRTEDDLLRKLRDRASRGELNGIDVKYRVTGGAPGEQVIDQEVHLSGPGPVRAHVRAPAVERRESAANLPEQEMKELLLTVSEGAGELIPRSEARFVPDSIVGQLSVTIDGQEESFFFLADEKQAKQHGKELSPKAARLVDRLTHLHKRILTEQE